MKKILSVILALSFLLSGIPQISAENSAPSQKQEENNRVKTATADNITKKQFDIVKRMIESINSVSRDIEVLASSFSDLIIKAENGSAKQKEVDAQIGKIVKVAFLNLF